MKTLLKNELSILAAILLTSAVFVFTTCKEKPTPPVVETIPVTEVSYSTASSGGAVTDEGGAPLTGRGVCWSSSAEPTVSDSKTSEDGGIGAFTSTLTMLKGGTTYLVRAYASNEAGTAYGKVVDFTTMQSKQAEITTAEATAITQTTATSGGNITNDYGAEVTTRGICWSSSPGPTIELPTKTIDGTGSGAFVSYLTQLTPGTKYYVKAYATNIIGTSYGNEVTFTTSEITTAVMTTTPITSVTNNAAVSGGNIINDNGGPITARGICWSTATDPTVALVTKTTNGTGTGSFTANISGLQPGTTYYVRAYATNSAGTAYGNQITFNTMIADVEGNLYNIVVIGSQRWMKENLKTTRYNDNTAIPYIPGYSDWATTTTPGYCWYNNDEATNKSVYGALYNWYVVNAASNGGKNVCPVGWHVPSDAEWTALVTYLGGDESVAGAKMKEAGFAHWAQPNTGATNATGFTALPAGVRNTSAGSFDQIGYYTYFWSTTENNSWSGWSRELQSWYSTLLRTERSKPDGFSVRCLR